MIQIRRGALASVLLLAACSDNPYKPSAWLTEVPADTRALRDPLPRTGSHAEAGREAYDLYCASCHGSDGGGRRGRPSLRNPRVSEETDGEIYWILKNGSKGHGMPAWRLLGDPALWQMIQYIRTLPPATK